MRRSDLIHYEDDAGVLADLNDQQFADFADWMKRLDVEHKKTGSFYGQGSLWSLTGAACWLLWFRAGVTPEDALAEDLACDNF